jgi:hypothetical protein
MLNQILEMLQIAKDYQGNEVIEIAKGKYQYTTNYVQLFKKAVSWQLKR